MNTHHDFRTVEDLVNLRKTGFMVPNPEYQRGEVWLPGQKKRLIDSVLRDYQLPMIYLHKITTTVAGMTQDRLEIIDGQQRINALREFVEGAFPLFEIGDPKAKFPPFLKDKDCDWGGMHFDSLPDELQDKLLTTELPVAYITTDDMNEVRDLFVRLQSGLPLNPQQKRDAYPGNFTEFILKLGGKPDMARFPGHGFFQQVLRMDPGKDSGKTRQLAAQIAILFFKRRCGEDYSDINAAAIDDYYYDHLDFDTSHTDSVRLYRILDLLTQQLDGWKGPKLLAHNAIHLVLFVDSILDDYTRTWEADLLKAQQQFSQVFVDSKIAVRNGEHDETWVKYGQWTRTSADQGEYIKRRHDYYSARMMEFLDPVPKDPARAFNLLEKEAIYWRDRGKCQVCEKEVDWGGAEFHHVKEHQYGGKTELSNGVLVHGHCHPKGQAAVEFAKIYQGPGA